LDLIHDSRKVGLILWKISKKASLGYRNLSTIGNENIKLNTRIFKKRTGFL
jgi:hypothetical protein